MSAQRRSSSLNGRHTSTGTPKSQNSSGITYPVIRQRGYYSDILGGEPKEELGVGVKKARDWITLSEGILIHNSARGKSRLFKLHAKLFVMYTV